LAPGCSLTLDRRAKVIERLEEQKLPNDPTYECTARSSGSKDGERIVVERHQRVLPWRRSAQNGTFAFFIRVGFKPIEFTKHKTAIAVASHDKPPSVTDPLIPARNSGRDEQMPGAVEPAETRSCSPAPTEPPS
jgi:hypothetical protein